MLTSHNILQDRLKQTYQTFLARHAQAQSAMGQNPGQQQAGMAARQGMQGFGQHGQEGATAMKRSA
jgi:hypothetical protein